MTMTTMAAMAVPFWMCVFFAILQVTHGTTKVIPEISGMSPTAGGCGGEVRITIYGKGFSPDQFSQNDDPNSGNHVYFVGVLSHRLFSCNVLKDGCTETQIVCYSPSGMCVQEEQYRVKVKVDGTYVDDSNICSGSLTDSRCLYTAKESLTPIIESLSYQSACPGCEVLHASGRIFTDRYGSNIQASSNGKNTKIIRVYVGPNVCELKDGDNKYGLALHNGSTDYGYFACLIKGKSLGSYRVSLLLEAPYGRSMVSRDSEQVSHNDTVYNVQMYPVILSVNHHEGSVAGGLRLIIFVENIDDRSPYFPVKVFVGDTVCVITKVVSDQYVECIVAADPKYTGSFHPGNRGLFLEFWENTKKNASNLNEVLSLTSQSEGYSAIWLDDTNYKNATMKYTSSKMTMLFKPPKSGQYQYLLCTSDVASLIMNGIEIVTSNNTCANSSRMTLDKNINYKLVVIHSESAGDGADVKVGAFFYNSTLTREKTLKADEEKQCIVITSKKINDTQTLNFNNFKNVSSVDEIQTVNILIPSECRFGLYGVYTHLISLASADGTTVANAINSLPLFDKQESVTATRNIGSNTSLASFNITISSKRGDFPLFEVLCKGNTNVWYNATEVRKGVPDGETVALEWGGRVSTPFAVSTLTAPILRDAFESMCGAKCPTFCEPSIKKFCNNFEEVSDTTHGERVKNVVPLDGRFCLKNPKKIYNEGDNLTKSAIFIEQSSQYLCFGYKGVLKDLIWLKYSYEDDSFKTKTKYNSFSHTFSKNPSTWLYTCFNIKDAVETKCPSGKKCKLVEVWVEQEILETDFYIDALFIGEREPAIAEETEPHLRCLQPAQLNGTIIDTVYVTGSWTSYTADLIPLECGNTLPLIELANGKVQIGSISSTSNSATLKLKNSGSEHVTVGRTSRASPPVTGFVGLMFKENNKSVNISLEPKDFEKDLGTLSGIGSITVEKYGDCANFELCVAFNTLPGDLPELMIDDKDLKGEEAHASVVTKVNGSLSYMPLPGEFLSTAESSSQITVFVNGIPARAKDGANLSFYWSYAATPNITDVSPKSGNMSTPITVSGTGFNTSTSGNNVTVGGVQCSVTAATANSITCTLPDGPIGSHKVNVMVLNKGFANHTNGDVNFTFTANITSITPTTGSLGGGPVLILGYGFKSGANVTINSRPCENVTVEPAKIQCILPPNDAGSYVVSVQLGSTTLKSSVNYSYNSTLTANVTSVSPSLIGVQGANVTITGKAFGSAKGNVNLAGQNMQVISWNDTNVLFWTGVINPGIQHINLEVNGSYAINITSGARPQLHVNLVVTNVYPLKGSTQGGTKLTITGSGFCLNKTLLQVKVGDVPCNVTSISSTQIKCTIGQAGRVHTVTNMGTSEANAYYAFDKPNITIAAGESILWQWITLSFINDIKHCIYEVDSPTSTKAKQGGFACSAPSPNGQYRHQFNQVGIYYISSGCLDTNCLKSYVGVVNVTESVSFLRAVSIKCAGKEALYHAGGANDPVDSSACGSVTTHKSGCSETTLSGGNATKIYFKHSTCSTPIITGINKNNGTVSTEITLTGEGLSAANCQNEIFIGDDICSVLSSFQTSVTCKMAETGKPPLFTLLPFSARVNNLGYALINKEYRFAVIPNIVDIIPTVSSTAGGANLTIKGFGFVDSAVVAIDSRECKITAKNYTHITCLTPKSTSQKEANVTVTMANGTLPFACETSTRKCIHTYATTHTPIVYSVFPNTTSGPTNFTITGKLLQTANLQVSIGGAPATVRNVASTEVKVNMTNIPAGNYTVVLINNYGRATDFGNVTVLVNLSINSVVPNSGSIHGNHITIKGNGFVENKTVVWIGSDKCNITNVTLGEVVCRTPAKAEGSYIVNVTSNGMSASSTYTYATASTPTVTSVSPTAGLAGNTLSIQGTNLLNNNGGTTVMLDDVPCTVTSNTATLIECTIGDHTTGSVPVSVEVNGYGASNNDTKFEYQLSLTSIMDIRGGTGGCQTVVLTGTGFNNNASVTICGKKCEFISATTTEYKCKTPDNTAQVCDVSMTINDLTRVLPSAFTYDASLTATVTGVSPTRGGTGGGTTITITGTDFGTSVNAVSVTVDGAECVVSSVTDTEIQCVTGPHLGTIMANVSVAISGNGYSQSNPDTAAAYEYIDLWSSTYSWGGLSPPEAGEFVVIPEGMTILLDTDTPVLKFLLIEGGSLIFDEKDVELQAEYILITNGGSLQVGTEAEPFQHKAIITVHGHVKSKELPIYGAKVLGVRNGTLELHGTPTLRTWTSLAATVNAGSTTITLVNPVNWKVGDEIVIASTGDSSSQSENEKNTITGISGDNKTLTLGSALEYGHTGTSEVIAGINVEMRAEVGLLTHNVVFRGSNNMQWNDKIEACPDGFDTGEFATQTCFQGRFGDEIGSDQFGAQIMIHATKPNTGAAQARLSYIEVTNAGQAFRLGRYPIHSHLNGDMSSSYVRGCSVHTTFNRAVNIHGTKNFMVEHNVIYNIMGGAFFLEDGIETGNTLQYNLAVFVKSSTSLLNDDITPAAFWLTNPNNTVQHNAAAGGTHFGFWYRMNEHPDGPSFTTDVCCKNVILGVFFNNTVHSFGWFGLWIFPDYFPLKGGCGGTEVEPAVFKSLTAWNNEKGLEFVNGGALQFTDLLLVNNELAGIEGKIISKAPIFTEDSPVVKNSYIVAKTPTAPNTLKCTKGGIVLPYGHGFRVVNVTFANFDHSECAAFRWTRIDGTCKHYCGGYSYLLEKITYYNTPNKGVYEWHYEGMLIDKDGTATGLSSEGYVVVPAHDALPSDCFEAQNFSRAAICPSKYKFLRFSFNNISPSSLAGKNVMIYTQYGNNSAPYAKKRLTHKFGWMIALVSGTTTKIAFENAGSVTNISFTGTINALQAGDWVCIEMHLNGKPDRFSIDGGKTFINASANLNPATAHNGDWTWDSVTKTIKFIVHSQQRSKRDVTSDTDRIIDLEIYKCYIENCTTPPDTDQLPPADKRPDNYEYWSNTHLWNDTQDGYITSVPGGENGTYGIPQALDNVKILYDQWVVINNTSPAKMGILLLEGVLELIDTLGVSYEVNAELIIIMGGRLVVGWPNDPFKAQASFTLRGSCITMLLPNGLQITDKSIGVYGGLDLIGKNYTSWTKLAATAQAGTNTIVLKDPVDWVVGHEIVISPTSYNMWQKEIFKIVSVSADYKTLTLNATLQHDHKVYTETLSGKVVSFAAAVGLLTKNIKIIGEDSADMYKKSCGARVLVGLFVYNGQTYTGYARLLGVGFYYTGQEGYTEEFDPRFSLAFQNTGNVSNIKPSSVAYCSFHHNFNTAIGVFGTNSLNISNNVIHYVVGNGMMIKAYGTRIINNLVVLVLFTGSYQGRHEPFNFRWEAGVYAVEAVAPVMKDNLVAGSERAAYRVPTLSCTDTSSSYINNHAHSSIIGLLVLPHDKLDGDCVMFSEFLIWWIHDFGIHYQNSPSLKLTNIVVMQTRHSIYTYVVGPSAVEHLKQDKTVEISNSSIIGRPSTSDCDAYDSPKGGFMRLSSLARVRLGPTGGFIGISFGTFAEGGNAAPTMAFENGMAYPTIGGLMKLINIQFAHFGNHCIRRDYALATTKGTDDFQHPVYSTGAIFNNVDEDSKIVYHRPNVGKINSADCIDMDCDAMKKALFKDMDGTFLGAVGTVLPQSEFEWDGNRQHGLGDYRIPKMMLSDPDGNKLDINNVAPNKGIIRSSSCTYMPAMQAYKCLGGYNYEILVIENMDSDTETRRLSPVAILGDRFVDLINGPQDHGWCSGYTCRKRLSTFMAVVATGKVYFVYFTGTTPLNMRYYLLNSKATDVIKVCVWYARPNRLDFYVDGVLIMATNARYQQGEYILDIPKGDEYTPNMANATGTNFVDRKTGLACFIIKGPQRIDAKTKEVVMVSFTLPAMTVETFFGANIVNNLAEFLNIPLSKVRLASAVSASGSGRRRRRSTAGIVVTFEIGDSPNVNLTVQATDSTDIETLLAYASAVVNECQVGNIFEAFNVSGFCNSVEVPTQEAAVDMVIYSAGRVAQLVLTAAPVPLYEGVALQTQPKVQALDISGIVIPELGTSDYPWQISASIRSGTGHSSAVLGGTTTVTSSGGWMNFTDLTISHMGNGYILDFNVTYPTAAENFTLASDPFDVSGRPLKANVHQMTSSYAVKNTGFTVTLDLRDENTDEIISDIAWRGHTWKVTATLLGTSNYGSLIGTKTLYFDESSGQALFPDVAITGIGVYYLQYVVVSSPAGFNFTSNQMVAVIDASHVGMVPEDTSEIQVKFDEDFRKVLPTTETEIEFESQMFQEFANLYSIVRLSPGSLREGSIILTFTVEGSVADVNSTAYTLCDSIFNNTQYFYGGYTLTLSPYMTINNIEFYGVSCGSTTSAVPDDDDGMLHPGIIAAIVIAVLAVIIAVIALVVWKVCIRSQAKIHTRKFNVKAFSSKSYDMQKEMDTRHLGSKNWKTENVLFAENSFTSMKFSMDGTSSPLPPVDTKFGYTSKSSGNQSRVGQSVFIHTPQTANPKPGPVNVNSLNASNASTAPKLHRANSALSDRGSPLPPVGNNTYDSEDCLTTSPVPMKSGSHLQVTSQQPSAKKDGRF